MGENVDTSASAGTLAQRGGVQQRGSVLTDALATTVFGGFQILRQSPRQSGPVCHRRNAQPCSHALQGPAQIDGRGPRGSERLHRTVEIPVIGCCRQRNREASGRRKTDQRRTPHQHRADRVGARLETAQFNPQMLQWQARLIQHIDAALLRQEPKRW